MKVKFLDRHEKEFETLEGADLGSANLQGGMSLKGASDAGVYRQL